MERKKLIVTGLKAGAAFIVLIFIILWMFGSFTHKIAPGVAEAPVETAPAGAATGQVEETVVPVVEEAAGTVESSRKTMVSSLVMATIREVRVVAGQSVQKGDVLIVLDNRDLEALAREAKRAVDAAAATRSQAASDFARARKLQGQGIISNSEFDQTRSAFEVADAQFERARQAQQAADVQLSYAEIRSPVSGRVVDRLADPGDTAVPGKPLLSVYDPNALRIEVPVRESLAITLKIGEALQVRVGAGGNLLAGTVDEIVPQAETGSRTFLVKVGLPAEPEIYAGMFGRIYLPAGERKRLTMPEAAAVQIGQLTFVDVLDPDRHVSRCLVTLGRPAGEGRVEVLSGLNRGDEVLLAGWNQAGTERKR
jgi:membrane fusion protein, multidrug efflux system